VKTITTPEGNARARQTQVKFKANFSQCWNDLTVWYEIHSLNPAPHMRTPVSAISLISAAERILAEIISSDVALLVTFNQAIDEF
jgi:hypothetical protein